MRSSNDDTRVTPAARAIASQIRVSVVIAPVCDADRPGALRTGTADEQHHRLAPVGPAQGPDQLLSPGQSLQVQADDLGAGIVDQVLEKFCRRHVDGVADRRELRETESGAVAGLQDVAGETAALGQHAHASRHTGCAGLEALPPARAVDAHAVGPEQPDARGPGGLLELLLEGRPARAGLTEAAADDVHETRRARSLTHESRARRRRDGREQVVDAAGDFGDGPRPPVSRRSAQRTGGSRRDPATSPPPGRPPRSGCRR